MFVSKQWRPYERGHNLYIPSMPFAPINRRTNSTADLSPLWLNYGPAAAILSPRLPGGNAIA